MLARRRIDWPKIVGTEAADPVWREEPARSELAALLLTLGDLFAIHHPDDLLRRAVELALDPIGLVRAGIYLYDARLDLMLGTWGTGLRRQVVDEHQAMFRLGEQGARVFARAMSGEAMWTVIENSPLIVNEERRTRVVGRGWVVCTPIRSNRRPLGMLYNDPGLTRTRIDPGKQARAAALCALVGQLLEGIPRSQGRAFVAGARARHPAITEAAQALTADPSLSARDLAADLRVSQSRFARVFKAEMGVSLVGYRNQVRLERFHGLVNGGHTNLRRAALEAGFGSYAQFHRVFLAQQGTSPRAHLGSLRARRAASPSEDR